MKCEDVSNELIAYLDRRANSAERQEVEKHLAACGDCRTRAEEFRKLWNVLDEVPVVEPSFGFDARLRQRVAAEPRRSWFTWLVPEPRLALSMGLLIALGVWMARLPQAPRSGLGAGTGGLGTSMSAAGLSEDEQFQMIKELDVLENFDVLSKSDALAELPPPAATQPQPESDKTQDNGGA
jgi:anti-sigma factor RsiW